MSRLAIVPARGGSKRVPDKNIRPFCGKPMIAHVLGTARTSGLFEEIHVSTDSDRIAGIAAALGFTPAFRRPGELADDRTPIMPVLRHAMQILEQRGRRFEEVWLLYACAALLDAADLRGAADLYARHGGARAVISVAQYPASVEWAYRMAADGALTAAQPGMFAVRSQDLAPAWYDAAAFIAYPRARVLDEDAAGDAGFIGYKLPRHRAVDIDDEDDWKLAEALFRGRGEIDRSPTARLAGFKAVLRIEIAGGGDLRALGAEDVTNAYVRGLNHPEVNRHLSLRRQPPQTLGSVRAYVAVNREDPRAVLLGLYVGNALRGTVRLHDIDDQALSAIVGIAIFDRSAWGRGWGSKALSAVAAFAAGQLGLRRLTAGIEGANERSAKAFARAGFRVCSVGDGFVAEWTETP